MATPDSDPENRTTSIRDLRWSAAEKKVARQSFDRALHREFGAVIHETQRRAAAIKQPSNLWDLEDYLRERRKDIDARYDYRYSVLLFVFADLISTGRLREEELHGLSEDKLDHIRALASR
jgi:hypothetical protein